MKKSKILTLALFCVTGVIVSSFIYISFLRNEKSNLLEKFTYDSTLRINAVNRLIESNKNTLFSMRNFFYGSNFVDRNEFSYFTSSFLEASMGISSVGWLPKIGKDNLENYKYLYYDSKLKNSEIITSTDMDRDNYFPLTYFEPFNKDSRYFSMDLSFLSDIYPEVLDSSLYKNEYTLLSSELFKKEIPLENSMIMLLPVFTGSRSPDIKDMNIENLKGYVFSIISIEELLKDSLSFFDNEEIKITILSGKSDLRQQAELSVQSSLLSGDSNWIIYCEATDKFSGNNRSNQPFYIFLLTLVLTMLITFYLYKNIGYTSRIENLVEKRSRELKISRKRLDLAIEGGELGCWELDFQTGKITTNSQLTEMMGYRTAVIDSLDVFFNLIHEDDRAEAVTKFKNHISGKSLYFESEHRIKTVSDHWLWILTKGQIVERDEEGNPLQLSGVQIDISKMKNMQNILFKEATIDDLTGLYNRRYFRKRLNELIDKSKRINAGFSIAVVDLDFFKAVNDTYGHKGGDMILKEFSSFLQKSLRPYDFIGRIGGEEFEIAFENESAESVHKIMDRIRLNIEKKIFPYKNESIKITFSTGISSFSEIKGEESEEEERLFRLADKRLYYAKSKGRNLVISQ